MYYDDIYSETIMRRTCDLCICVHEFYYNHHKGHRITTLGNNVKAKGFQILLHRVTIISW